MSAAGKRTGTLGLLGTSWRLMVKRCPREAFLIACFTVVGSAFAGAVTYGWKLFFGATYSLTRGDATVNRFLYGFALFVIVYAAQNAFKVLSRLYQPKFMEEVKFSILGEIHEKVDAIPAEYYEDPSLYDTMHRANDIVSSGRFMRFFLNGIAAVQEIITVVSVSLVLVSFSLWLIPLCFVSVLPSFAARVVRGTRYYYMKVYQTPRTCYATGMRFLTVWQNFSGAWRIYILYMRRLCLGASATYGRDPDLAIAACREGAVFAYHLSFIDDIGGFLALKANYAKCIN